MQPTNDLTGIDDTHNLLWELSNKKHVVLELGNYYFTKTGVSSLAMIPITQDGVTIDGVDWNHTKLHMVGEEENPGADWYVFYLNGRKGFTLKNVTIDGGLLNTTSEQTHGIVAIHPADCLFQNIRGQYIYGDTVKLGYSASNVCFKDTEHLYNGRSGISMRSNVDNRLHTGGGVTIDGFLARDISDQAIDMEPGFEPGELIIQNGRIYSRAETNSLCLALNGFEGARGARLNMSNFQVYGATGLYNLREAVISNCIFDSTDFNGRTLDVRKGCQDVVIGNSIIKGNGANDGLIYMSVHGELRPNHISLNNLDLIVENTADNTGCGVYIYDCQNVSLNNIDIQSSHKLQFGVYRRDVTASIDRGYFDVRGLKIRNAADGIHVKHSASAVSAIDTLTVQGCHFRDVGAAVRVNNPEPAVGAYIRDWNFYGNVYGENVANEVVMGSVFG